MKRGQVLRTPEGVQVALFPLENMRITQGIYGQLPNGGTFSSHRKTLAMDFNTLRFWDVVYAPFDCELVSVKDANHTLEFKSTETVLCSDGVLRMLKFRILHDNDISTMEVGTVYKQGDKIADEGRQGKTDPKQYASHVHLDVNDLVTGKPLNPVNVFFVNDTILIEPMKYAWKKYENSGINVDDTVMVVGEYYYSGQKIPLWVKKVKHKVKQISGERVLLGGYIYNINSWVYKKDVKKVSK